MYNKNYVHNVCAYTMYTYTFVCACVRACEYLCIYCFLNIYSMSYVFEYVYYISLIIMSGFAERCRYAYLSEIRWPPTQTHEVHIKVRVTFMSPFFKLLTGLVYNTLYFVFCYA